MDIKQRKSAPGSETTKLKCHKEKIVYSMHLLL